ncbi:synemin [Rhinatrema bivittatum]|uniref:synemin n=1 Tax=Rhinatrema bivittatum TaxID=194408 RepID=UPI001129D3F7|nr:synemin [Rhinatrema bivittatum]
MRAALLRPAQSAAQHPTMFRPGIGEEKLELQELNHRLQLYLARVRQLEQQNGALLQEIGRLGPGREGSSGGGGGYRQEAQQLRGHLQELSAAKSRAELQLYHLGRELQRLLLLGGEAREGRARLDAELQGCRRELQEARRAEGALQELLLQLQAQRCFLQEAQEREALELQGQRRLLVLPAQPSPALSLQEVQSCALLLARAWEESFLPYQEKVAGLEEQVRAERRSWEQAARERERCALQAQELQREAQELQGGRRSLEEELLEMKERYRLRVQEYQVIIEALEEEKQSLGLSVTDRLREYHELMRVQSGLTLEVAAYRALLEGESNEERIIWTERRGREIPPGVGIFASDQSTKYSAHQRENEKVTFPIIRTSVDARPKGPSSSAPFLNLVMHSGLPTTDTGRVFRKDVSNSSYRPPAVTVREESSYERAARVHPGFGTMSPRYDFARSSGMQQKIFPERRERETITSASSFLAKKPPVHIQVLDRDHGSDALHDTESKEPKSDFLGRRYKQSEEGRDVILNRKAKEDVSGNLGGKMMEDKAKENKRARTLEEKTETAKEKRNVSEILTTEGNSFIPEETKKEAKGVKQTESVIWGEKNKEEELSRTEREATLTGQDMENEAAGQTYVAPEEKIKNYESAKGNETFTVEEKTQKGLGYEIPVIFGEQVLQKNSREGTRFSEFHPKASLGTDASEDATKPTEFTEVQGQGRQTKGGGTSYRSEKETSWKERLGENITPADIFKPFGQPGNWERTGDQKMTYVESKEHTSDGAEKAEITLQSATDGDADLADKADLEALINRDVKRMIPEDLKGTAAEDLIESIIHAGLKGKHAMGTMSVNVEIVEEPLGSVMDEKSEFSTPFHVEEVDDACPDVECNYGGDVSGEALRDSLTAEELRGKTLPGEGTRNVQEVTEEDDTSEEVNYIVSTPDDFPLVHDQEDDSIYGQIHIEEESTIKYSWQDECSQSTRSKRTISGLHGYDGPGQSEIVSQSTGGITSTYASKEEQPKEETSHTEAVVTEREIKIPHDFQTSFVELLSQETKDPKHQLKGALEQLQGSLPESLREELSVLTSNGQADSDKLAVDIKKVEQTSDSGRVTIVAEINVSQMLDTDNRDLLQHIEGSMSETPSVQSLHGEVSENLKHQQVESKVTSGKDTEIETSSFNNQSMPWMGQEFYSSSTLKGSDGVECYTAEQVIHQPTISEEDGSPTGERSTAEISTDIHRFVRHIKLGPREAQTSEQILFEGPISELLEASAAGERSPIESFTDINRSVKHIKLGPKEIHITEEVLLQGPISQTLGIGSTADLSQTEGSSDASTSRCHIRIGPTEFHTTEQIIFEGPISEMPGASDTEGSTNVNRSIRHIKLGSKQIHTHQQIIQEDPISEHLQLSGVENLPQTEDLADHLKLSPKDIQSPKEIIFEEPVSEMLQFSDTDLSQFEESPDSNRSIRHIKLNEKEFHSPEIIFEEPVSEISGSSATGDHSLSKESIDIKSNAKEFNSPEIIFEGPISESLRSNDKEDHSPSKEFPDITRSIEHIKLDQKEFQSSEIIFEGPISETLQSNDAEDLSQSEESTDGNRSIRHITLNSKGFNSPEIIFEGPISEILRSNDKEDHSPSEESPDITRSIEHIKLGPKEFQSAEIIFEGPISETQGSRDTGDLSQLEESPESNISIRHIKLNAKEFHSPEIIFEGPISEILRSNDKEDHSPSEESPDIIRSIEHIKLGPKEFQSAEIIFEGPISEILGSNDKGDHSPSEEFPDSNISIRHIKLNAKEFHSPEIIFEGPISETQGSCDTRDVSQLEESTDGNRSIRHIKLNSKGFHSPEIIFEGPISEILGSNDKGDHSPSEESPDITRSIRHIKLNAKEFHSPEIIFEGPISEILGSNDKGDHSPSEESPDITRSIEHIKLGPKEFQSAEIIFEGPVSEAQGSHDTRDLSHFEESTDGNRSIRHIKLGPNENSFTFQMDITKLPTESPGAAGVQEHSMIFSSRKSVKEPEVSWVQNVYGSDQKDDGREKGKEASISVFSDSHGENIQTCSQQIIDMSMFDKTVQLQRMVDQRSVLSDEEKIAIIYLDNEDDS